MLFVAFFPILFTCVSTLNENLKIIGGDLAVPGQFPYVGSLVVNNDNYKGHTCGTIIIGTQWLLTLGTCIYRANFTKFTILTGTTSLNNSGTNYTIANTFFPDNFEYSTYKNDLSLIKTTEEIFFSYTTDKIELGRGEINETCTVVGYGSGNDLKFLDTTYLSEEDCERLAIGGPYNWERSESQVCAFNFDKFAPCIGDAGAPLVCHGQLAAVLSYGILPCALTYPDVYTKVYNYKEWIAETIKNN